VSICCWIKFYYLIKIISKIAIAVVASIKEIHLSKASELRLSSSLFCSFHPHNCSGNTNNNVIGFVGGNDLIVKNSGTTGNLNLMNGGHNTRLNIDSNGNATF